MSTRGNSCWLCIILFLGTILDVSVPTGMALAEKPSYPSLETTEIQYLVQVASEANAAQVAARAGMEIIGQSQVETSWYFMRPLTEQSRSEVLATLQATPGVVHAAAGAGVSRSRMAFTPNDPYFFTEGGGWGNPGQWYLANPFAPGVDINVQGAWDRDITGAGVTIGFVDDCLQTAHPDLAPNYSPGLSWDFGENDPDPNPVWSDDMHGTSTAGLAAGRGGNGIGITGTAPYAGLAGLRVDFWNQTEQMFVDATLYRSDAIKVKNHSYGISVDYVPEDALVMANRLAAAQGVINVRAAGNEFGNANAKAAQADRTALTVAALGIDGRYAYYSNYGACVFVTAPSSDEGPPAITTTDLTGSAGYNDGSNPTFPDSNYTVDFGGTSAAAPQVSGVVAQILQVNPNLDIRGVKHILARTSKKVDPGDPEWVTNGAGYHFNPHYGFGLVDADAATELAATFTPPPIETSYTTGRIEVNEAIPDDDPTGVSYLFDMLGDAPLETVEVAVEVTHTYPGDLDILLTSPFGTSSHLAYVYSWPFEENLDWTFSSAAFWGEDLTGTWELTVADMWAMDEGIWDSFMFTAYAGVPEPATLGLLLVGGLVLLRRRLDV